LHANRQTLLIGCGVKRYVAVLRVSGAILPEGETGF
jgi:hypothetical protein